MSRRIKTFIALSIGLGALVDLTFYQLGLTEDAMMWLVWGLARMYTPTIASVAVAGPRIVKKYIRLDMGVLKHYLLSPLIAYAALAVYMAITVPLGVTDLSRLGALLPVKLDPLALILLILLNSYIAAITINAVFALGEEIGWRGFLQDSLEEAGISPARAVLVAGILWGIWHAPAILILGYNYPDNRQAGVLVFTALTVSMSPPHWISRAASSSILPASSLHGSVNAIWGITVAAGKIPREFGGLGPPAVVSWAIISIILYSVFRRVRSRAMASREGFA